MRKFIISDLHGNGFVYDSVLNFLQNERDYGNDEITLYINGDLIDRGVDSGSMLVDIQTRIEENIGVPIKYLGGNHELMMYNAYKDTYCEDMKYLFEPIISRKANTWTHRNDGYLTSRYLKKYYTKEEIQKLCEFIGNLDVYYKFDEKINDKNILLVHACPVKAMEEDKELKINDGSTATEVAVWTRKSDLFGRGKIGNDNFFNIIGHTPLEVRTGYEYDKEENILNIDGASALFSYLNTRFYYRKKNMFQSIEDMYIPLSEYDYEAEKELDPVSHSPLVEILDNKLRILTFNYKNEILYGNYFEDGESHEMDYTELSKYRKNLKENPKVLKRVNKCIKTN